MLRGMQAQDFVWFRRNAGLWNNSATANPATGVGGYSAPATGTHMLCASSWVVGEVISVKTEVADFTGVPLAGFLSWMDEVIPLPSIADAWNVNDKSAGITLSNNDKTASAAVAGNYVRSTTKYAGATEKYYAEFLLTGTETVSIGLQDATVALNGTKFFSYGPLTSYVSINAGSNLGGATGAVPGDVVSLAWDTVAKRGWFRVNNGNWFNNGNPATGAGGYDLSAITANPHALFYYLAAAGSVTLRTEKDEFTQTTPSGFKSWMGETLILLPVEGTGALACASATAPGFGKSESRGTGALAAVPSSHGNSLTYSQEFGTGGWALNNVTVTANALAAPDGTITAERVADTAANALHNMMEYSVGTEDVGSYTYSIHAKAGSLSWIKLYYSSGSAAWANFNVSNGTLGQVNGGTANITPLADGWYRCSITFSAASAGSSQQCYVLMAQGDTGLSPYVGSGGTINVWGVQLEKSSVVGAYVPTSNVAVFIYETLVGTGIVAWRATGALVAGATRTNLLRYSEQLDQALYEKSAVVVTPNTSPSPDSTVTAETVADTAINSPHYVGPQISGLSIGGTYTFSIYAKNISRTWLTLYNNGDGGYANFNLATGVKGVQGFGGVATIQAVGDGWLRCSMSVVTALTNPRFFFLLNTGDTAGLFTYVGDGSSLLLWGAQVEAGGVATAYIPTTGTPVSVGSTPVLLTGVGEVTTPPAFGTGVLTTGIADLDAFGDVRSTGTGALTATGIGRTNLSIYSQQLDHPQWTLSKATIVADTVAAPDGTMTAETVTTNASAGVHGLYSTATIPAPSSTYTHSIHAKAGTGQWLQIYSNGGQCNFDLVNGVKGYQGATSVGAITNLGNGWYRCSMASGNSGSALQPQFFLLDRDNTIAGGDHATSGLSLHLWGAQSELGTGPNTYIPTLATAVTIYDTLVGTGISQVVATGALAASTSVLAGVGLSESVQTSAALLSQSNFLQLGSGISRSVGSGSAFADIAISGAGGPYTWGSTTNPKLGQSFTAIGSAVSKVRLNLLMSGAPTDGLVVKIFTVDAGHLPVTQIGVTSDVVPASSLTYASAPYDFTFSTPVAVTEGVEYAAVVERTGAPESTNRYRITIVGADAYAGGAMLEFYSGSWGLFYLGGELACTITNITAGGLSSVPSVLTGAGGVVMPTGTGTLVAGAARTNIMLRSEQLDVSPWTTASAVVTANAATAPDSTITAERLADTTNNSSHYAIQSGTLPTVAGKVTFSIYLKSAGHTWVCIGANVSAGYWADFNLVTGELGLKNSSTVSRIEALADGWYRCSITATATNFPSGSAYVAFLPSDIGGTPVYVGTGTAIYVWGGQVEKGDAATDYLPTTTAPVTVGVPLLAGVGEVITPPAIGTGALACGVASFVDTFGVSRSFGTAALAALGVNSRTNIILNSQAVDLWTKQFTSVVANDTAAPDGTVTADRVTDDASNVYHFVRPSVAALATAVHTYSVYLKKGTLEWAQLFINSTSSGVCWANFNLTLGTVGLVQDALTPRITDVGNGWWRCSITKLVDNSVAGNTYLFLLPGNISAGAPSYVGSGQSLYAWGGQFELGSAPTAYIPTAAAPESVGTVLVGTGTSSIAATGVLAASNTVSVGVGLSESRSTSAALAAQSNLLQLGFGVSRSVGTGTPTANAAIVTGAGLGPSWVGAAAIASAPATLAGAGVSAWVGFGVLTNPDLSKIVGVGLGRWAASGTMPAQLAALTGAGISHSFGIAALTSPSADIDALGSAAFGVSGTGELITSATLTGVGVSRSFGTSALSNTASAVVASGVSRSLGTGTTPSAPSALSAFGLGSSVGTGSPTAQVATVVGSGASRWVATGVLPSGTASVVSTGVVRWAASGALVPSVAAAAGVGVSSSRITFAALQATVANLVGFEGVTIISGAGTIPAQSHTLDAVGRVIAIGTVASLVPSAASLAGAGLSRSQGAAPLLSQASVINGTGQANVSGFGVLVPSVSAVAGAGVIAAAPTGTGVLAAQVSALAGEGVRQWVATAILSAQAADVTGAGKTGWQGSGALAAQVAAATGAGLARWIATGVLPAGEITPYRRGAVVLARDRSVTGSTLDHLWIRGRLLNFGRWCAPRPVGADRCPRHGRMAGRGRSGRWRAFPERRFRLRVARNRRSGCFGPRHGRGRGGQPGRGRGRSGVEACDHVRRCGAGHQRRWRTGRAGPRARGRGQADRHRLGCAAAHHAGGDRGRRLLWFGRLRCGGFTSGADARLLHLGGVCERDACRFQCDNCRHRTGRHSRHW